MGSPRAVFGGKNICREKKKGRPFICKFNFYFQTAFTEIHGFNRNCLRFAAKLSDHTQNVFSITPQSNCWAVKLTAERSLIRVPDRDTLLSEHMLLIRDKFHLGFG
jgi:hypothetical protein